MLDFLTHDDLIDLTGLNQPAAQVRWLKDRGWKFETTSTGAVRVARAYFRARMESIETTPPPAPAKIWNVRPGLLAVK